MILVGVYKYIMHELLVDTILEGRDSFEAWKGGQGREVEGSGDDGGSDSVCEQLVAQSSPRLL